MKDESVEAKFLRITAEIVANKRWRKLLAGDGRDEMQALEAIAKRYGGEDRLNLVCHPIRCSLLWA
jgi:hypothetical protein